MPFNGSGTFVRGFSWVNDATNSIPITASRVDSDTNDIVNNGLGLCLTRDGQGSATANLPMNGFRHTGASNGVALTDYATMGQIAPLAPLTSPAFAGVPTAPTAAPGNNTTQLATTAFVTNATASYLPLSGGTVNSLTIGPGILTMNNSIGLPAQGGGNIYYTGTTGGPVTGAVIIGDGTGWNYSFAKRFGSANTVTHNFKDDGSFSCIGLATLAGGTSTTTLASSGAFTYQTVTMPHIFVQAGTPTAIAVGDLWFF